MQRRVQILQAFHCVEGCFRTQVPEWVTQGYADMLARDVSTEYAHRHFLEEVSERSAEELPAGVLPLETLNKPSTLNNPPHLF